MVDRCVAVASHNVAAVTNHHPHREFARLSVDLAAFTFSVYMEPSSYQSQKMPDRLRKTAEPRTARIVAEV